METAPNEFQNNIDQTVNDLDVSAAYFDYILIQGSSIQKCNAGLLEVFINKENTTFSGTKKNVSLFKKKYIALDKLFLKIVKKNQMKK